MGWQRLAAYCLHPSLCLGLVLLGCAAYAASTSSVRLTANERRAARFWLLNGVVVHVVFDGFVGAYKTNEILFEQYTMVDSRYAADPSTAQGATVYVLSLIELYVMGPVCVWLYHLYHQGSPARDVVEVLAAAMQMFGTVIYIGCEIATGGHSLLVDRGFALTFDHVVYFWFAVVFCCALWIVVPGSYLCASFGRIIATQEAARGVVVANGNGRVGTQRRGQSPARRR